MTTAYFIREFYLLFGRVCVPILIVILLLVTTFGGAIALDAPKPTIAVFNSPKGFEPFLGNFERSYSMDDTDIALYFLGSKDELEFLPIILTNVLNELFGSNTKTFHYFEISWKNDRKLKFLVLFRKAFEESDDKEFNCMAAYLLGKAVEGSLPALTGSISLPDSCHS